MNILVDPLRIKARELEDQFTATGEYNPDAWSELIGEFESAGRLAGAEDIRRRSETCASMAMVPA